MIFARPGVDAQPSAAVDLPSWPRFACFACALPWSALCGATLDGKHHRRSHDRERTCRLSCNSLITSHASQPCRAPAASDSGVVDLTSDCEEAADTAAARQTAAAPQGAQRHDKRPRPAAGAASEPAAKRPAPQPGAAARSDTLALAMCSLTRLLWARHYVWNRRDKSFCFPLTIAGGRRLGESRHSSGHPPVPQSRSST